LATPNLKKMDMDALKTYVAKASPDELKICIASMSAEQIKAAIKQIDKGKDPKWDQKVESAVLGLSDRSQLEVAAANLSVEQLIHLINTTLQVQSKQHWKLSPVLIAIPFSVFSQCLAFCSEKELQVLQHEGVTEPVQHQLTSLSHEYLNQLQQIEKEINRFYQGIEHINVQELGRDDASEMFYKISVYSQFFENMFQNAGKALAIAWNTNRLDLIESFNQIKDSSQKYNQFAIGIPSEDTFAPSGLYAHLEKKLFAVYGDEDAGSGFDREALHDDEPAIEGLVKFSIWYLQDYWEIGLLPQIKNPEELDLDLSKYSEEQRKQHREKLFSLAQKNLKKIGLATVHDLKRAYIFSNKTLRSFIEERLS